MITLILNPKLLQCTTVQCSNRFKFSFILHSIIIVLALLLTSLAYGSDSKLSIIEGKWIIQEVVDVAPITGLDDAQLAAMVGQVLSIGSNEITFQKRVCKAPTFSWSHKNSQAFFRRYKMQIPKGWQFLMDRLDVQCNAAETIGPFILHGQDILFVWYGALLRAHKEK